MCIYFIYTERVNYEERFEMAVANLKKIDSKLKDMYKNQTTNAVADKVEPFVDRTELLLEQMNFIAAYNKQLLHIA